MIEFLKIVLFLNVCIGYSVLGVYFIFIPLQTFLIK